MTGDAATPSTSLGSMDMFLTTYSNLMSGFCGIFTRFSGDFRTIFGRFSDDFRTIFGRFSDDFRTIFGRFSVNFQSIFKLHRHALFVSYQNVQKNLPFRTPNDTLQI
jgi:hypothetical protein